MFLGDPDDEEEWDLWPCVSGAMRIGVVHWGRVLGWVTASNSTILGLAMGSGEVVARVALADWILS